jgi:hypothetical protein
LTNGYNRRASRRSWFFLPIFCESPPALVERIGGEFTDVFDEASLTKGEAKSNSARKADLETRY